jgi:hypothetical protein
MNIVDYDKVRPGKQCVMGTGGSYLPVGQVCQIIQGFHFDEGMRRYGVSVRPVEGRDSNSVFLVPIENIEVQDTPHIVLGGNTVVFLPDGIKVGCTRVTKEDIFKIYDVFNKGF